MQHFRTSRPHWQANDSMTVHKGLGYVENLDYSTQVQLIGDGTRLWCQLRDRIQGYIDPPTPLHLEWTNWQAGNKCTRG